jgi:agmatinase
MDKADKIKQFDPNGVGLKNGHFIGLPFDETDAQLVLLPVPWDVTVSYAAGTATAPANILEASTQLDLFDPDVPDAWQLGLYFRTIPEEWLALNNELRAKAERYIYFLENSGQVKDNSEMTGILHEINTACKALKNWVAKEATLLLEQGKKLGIVGGEHSCPLGLMEALSKQHGHFGILQIDAHMDLRDAYEGFTYSHASIFYNALQLQAVSHLTQVGIRDYCEAEAAFAAQDKRIRVFYDHDIQRQKFAQVSFQHIVKEVIETLPSKVYISFDIDGLAPGLCPNTGTPVPGGLSYHEAIYLLVELCRSGREIIGFDLCEVGGLGNEWDGNVGARILYKLANLCMYSSNK